MHVVFYFFLTLSGRKRKVSLCFTGKRQAEINVAEGQKTARILASEANKTEQVNAALGKDYVHFIYRGGHLIITARISSFREGSVFSLQ